MQSKVPPRVIVRPHGIHDQFFLISFLSFCVYLRLCVNFVFLVYWFIGTRNCVHSIGRRVFTNSIKKWLRSKQKNIWQRLETGNNTEQRQATFNSNWIFRAYGAIECTDIGESRKYWQKCVWKRVRLGEWNAICKLREERKKWKSKNTPADLYFEI